VKIEDKGEYTEQRYGAVNVYWNSIMVEASKEREGEEGGGRRGEEGEEEGKGARGW
jgi:hypothetical protein